MTVPSKSSLVLDGNEVKFRLIAERQECKTPVHIDWLRFTVRLRNAPPKIFDRPFSDVTNVTPEVRAEIERFEDRTQASKWVHEYLRELEHEARYSAAGQAYALGLQVIEALGPGFQLASMAEKGHDFYAKRFPILRNSIECGWIGFGVSSESPRQQAQANTLHVNLYGMACTFAAWGWQERMADLCDKTKADITRIDLALDFFDGHPVVKDLAEFGDQYKAGLMDIRGRRPVSDTAGDWLNGRSRSLYIGSREGGKQTNIYEKGHQLYGKDSGNPWLRIELRYGNKVRELPLDMLRRPADFFAGASDWHAQQLRHAEQCQFMPEPLPTRPQLAVQTIEAEAFRALKWCRDTARANLAAAWNYLGDDAFLELLSTFKLPGRLKAFGVEELRAAEKLLTVWNESPVPA